MKIDCKRFYEEVYEVVRQIPYGRVFTYGRIAELAGAPQYARLVGRALAGCPQHCRLPCHRVVNSGGSIAPHWPQQRWLLEKEGVFFRPNGKVDLKKSLWDIG